MECHIVDNVLLTEASSDDVTDSTHSLITYNNVIEGVDHLCMFACMYVCMYLSMYVCMYVCVCVCMYVYVYV